MSKNDEKKPLVDDVNKDILRMLRDDGRMSFTEIGEKLGMSRIAVMKRVRKLEAEGVIRGYRAIIHHEGAVKMMMEIVTVDDDIDDLLKYLNRIPYVKELYVMTSPKSSIVSGSKGSIASGSKGSIVYDQMENATPARIHVTAVAPEVSELKYLTKMVRKDFADSIEKIECHAVKEIVKDIYGGVDYGRSERNNINGNE